MSGCSSKPTSERITHVIRGTKTHLQHGERGHFSILVRALRRTLASVAHGRFLGRNDQRGRHRTGWTDFEAVTADRDTVEAAADVGVQWHPKRPPARRPALVATAFAFHLVVEMLKQVSHVHDVWPWAPGLNDGRVLSAQHASRASQDIAQRVDKKHHVDLRVLELRAKNPLRLTVDTLAPEEGPGRSVTSVDRIFRSRHAEHSLASA